jgi:hypothetical protein
LSLATRSEMGSARKYNDTALVGVRMWRVAGVPEPPRLLSADRGRHRGHPRPPRKA